MRSEKLNAKHNVISRLEVPVDVISAAPSSQRIRGWLVDCDGRCASFSVRVNGREIPHTRISRPDVKKGYQNVPESRIHGFETEVSVPGDNMQATISVVAVIDGEDEITLLENLFSVRTEDPELTALFEGCQNVLMKPASFAASFQAHPDFHGTFALLPPQMPGKDVSGSGLSVASVVLWRFRDLIFDTVNTHELYFAIYDYAASRISNLAISRLNLGVLLKGYVDAIGKWLKEAAGPDEYCIINDWAAAELPFFISRVFPNAHFEVERNTKVDPTWADQWQNTLALLGSRVRFIDGSLRKPATDGATLPADVTHASWPVCENERPIFVLGAGRSGTSVTMRILREGQYPSFMEGHIFPYMERQLNIIAKVWQNVDKYAREQHVIVPDRSVFEKPLVEMTAAGAKQDAQSLRWVDKTPDSRMIEVVPHLARLYPHAQYIYLRRHPLKLAESRNRKFNEPVGTALGEWLKCEQLWKQVKASIPEAARVEFDQTDFSLRTGETIKFLIEFLKPTAGQARRMFYAARVIRPQNTLVIGKGETEMGNDRRDYLYRQLLDLVPASLTDLQWPDAAVAYYHSQCREIAEELGYHEEPSLKEMASAIRHVSTEICDYEEFFVEEAHKQAHRTHAGLINSSLHLMQTLKTTLKKILRVK